MAAAVGAACRPLPWACVCPFRAARALVCLFPARLCEPLSGRGAGRLRRAPGPAAGLLQAQRGIQNPAAPRDLEEESPNSHTPAFLSCWREGAGPRGAEGLVGLPMGATQELGCGCDCVGLSREGHPRPARATAHSQPPVCSSLPSEQREAQARSHSKGIRWFVGQPHVWACDRGVHFPVPCQSWASWLWAPVDRSARVVAVYKLKVSKPNAQGHSSCTALSRSISEVTFG